MEIEAGTDLLYKTAKPNTMNFHLPENDDLKEIVFENRNKAYGAYRLRTDYHRTLNRSMGISMLAMSLLAGLVLIQHKVAPKDEVFDGSKKEILVVRELNLEPLVKGELKPLVPQAKPEMTPVIPKPLEHNFVATEKPVDQGTTTSTTATPETGSEAAPLASATTGTAPAGLPAVLSPEIPAGPVEMAGLDVLPEFPGGMEKFYKYLRKNLVFTSAAREARLAGRMYVNFVLGPDGKISTVKIVQRMGFGMDEVVETVLTKSPAWMPGKVKGQPVSTIVRLPINFTALQ